jgi:signal transduction histidine kinase
VYYVCAEGLSNVAKHASASHVRVAVTVDDGAVSAVIEDDGVGGANEALGSGLRGLADRVEATGGRVPLTSRPGRGTRLVAKVPQIGGTP